MRADRLCPTTTGQPPFGAVEAPPAAAALPAEQVAVPTELLDGGEVVLLAIKPSLWTVVFSSAQWVCVAAVIIALDWWSGRSLSAAIHVPVAEIALAVAGLRIGVGMMQWVAQAYVLTNRRIMRIRGVVRVEVFACPLVQVLGTEVTVSPPEAITRLGTIRFNTKADFSVRCWYHIAHAHEVHAEVRRAIERAFDRQA